MTFAEVGATGDTITRAAGSWISEGFAIGDTVTVSGAVASAGANNVTGALFTLTNAGNSPVTGVALTLTAGSAVWGKVAGIAGLPLAHILAAVGALPQG
mgnify:CR=1 FL=1